MTQTPWGDAKQLRSRMLRPGYRLSEEQVGRNQRWRLLAAMVATVVKRGYEATTVSEIVELSGVSRNAFYRHFANREECFLAAVDATVELVTATVGQAYRGSEGSWDERLRGAFEAFLAEVVAQPAAARMCFLEVYVAGEAAVARADGAALVFERMVRQSLQQSPERAGMPPAVVRGVVGGVRKIIFTRVRRGEEAQLPELVPGIAEWALSFRTPSAPLRRSQARMMGPGSVRLAEDDRVDRIYRAVATVVAEKGYAATTLDDVANAASTSFSTFYNFFRTKQEAFLGAYEAGLTQLQEATLRAAADAPDWPHAVRAAFEGFLGFLAANPEWARAGTLNVLAAGPQGMAAHDHAIDLFAALLQPGFELAPGLPPIAAEAAGGAVYTLIYDHVRRHGAERLMELHPAVTLIALAPFTGTEPALAVANEPLRRRRRSAS